MSVEVIDKIKPKNGGNFKIIDSVDVEMSDGSSLQESFTSISNTITDITNGKFDGAEKYYTMEEVIAKYYDKNEVDELLSIVEENIEDFQTLEDVKSLISTFFPIQLRQIDHDFEIYLEKSELADRVKEIMDDINIDSSKLDTESLINDLYNHFYKKEETYTKDEVKELFNSINQELISSWLSESHYNKKDIDTMLSSKLDSSYETGIADIRNMLELHIDSSEKNLIAVDTNLKELLNAGLNTKTGATEFNSLKDDFLRNKESTLESLINKCDESNVKDIIMAELEDGKMLSSAIDESVMDAYSDLTFRFNEFKNDIGLYARISFVNDELSKLKGIIGALDGTQFNEEYVNSIEELREQINQIKEDYATLAHVDSEVEKLVSEIESLNTEYTNAIAMIEVNKNSITEISETVIPGIDGKIQENAASITALDESVQKLNESTSGLDSELESLKEQVNNLEIYKDETGINIIKQDVEDIKANFGVLDAEPYLNEDSLEVYPEGSVYEKIFNSNRMKYMQDNFGEQIELVFNASDFNSRINSNQRLNTLNSEELSKVNTSISNVSSRLANTEGSIVDHSQSINEIRNKISSIDTYDGRIAAIEGDMVEISDKVNEIDELTAQSIITKINNSDELMKINSSNLDLRGSITSSSLSGDLSALLVKSQSGGVYINGKMISPNSIDNSSFNLKGLSIKSVIKNGSTTINKFESFGISNTGNVTITNPLILSTKFNSSDVSGYQLLPEGKAIFNNAEVKGKFILPNAGLYGLTDTSNNELSTVRIWAGSTEEDRAHAPFRVQQDGFLFASHAALGGTIAASTLHSGAVHVESDEIKINNNFVLLNNTENEIDEYLAGDEEKDYIILNSRESKFNTNIKFSDSFKYDINFKELDLNAKLNVVNNDSLFKVDSIGITIKNNVSEHKIQQNKNTGSLVFESGNNSNTSISDFVFASKDSVRNCEVQVKGSLKVTEEIRSDKNNVVMRSTENGFGFFAF